MHSIPYQWGSTSFSVNRDVYAGDINDTSIIFDPPEEVKGKINVLDSQGEVMLLASLHLGIPQCSTDREQLKALDALLQSAKPHWASFGSDIAKDVLVSGDAAVGMIWNGFLRQGTRGGRQHRVRLSASGLRRLDGQCRAPEGRTEPGERDQVHGFSCWSRRISPRLPTMRAMRQALRVSRRFWMRSWPRRRNPFRRPKHPPAPSSRCATRRRRRSTTRCGPA